MAKKMEMNRQRCAYLRRFDIVSLIQCEIFTSRSLLSRLGCLVFSFGIRGAPQGEDSSSQDGVPHLPKARIQSLARVSEYLSREDNEMEMRGWEKNSQMLKSLQSFCRLSSANLTLKLLLLRQFQELDSLMFDEVVGPLKS